MKRLNESDLADAVLFAQENIFSPGRQLNCFDVLVERDTSTVLQKSNLHNLVLSNAAKVAANNAGINMCIQFSEDEDNIYVSFKNYFAKEELHKVTYSKKKVFKYADDELPKSELWLIFIKRKDVLLPAVLLPLEKIGVA